MDKGRRDVLNHLITEWNESTAIQKISVKSDDAFYFSKPWYTIYIVGTNREIFSGTLSETCLYLKAMSMGQSLHNGDITIYSYDRIEK